MHKIKPIHFLHYHLCMFRLCAVKSYLARKHLEQISHIKGRSGLCVLVCLLRPDSVLNDLPHCSHTNILFSL